MTTEEITAFGTAPAATAPIPTSVPIFLGTCLRAVRFQFGLDLTRLSNFVMVPFFPIRIPDIALVFAIPTAFRHNAQEFQVQLTSLRRETLLTTIAVTTKSGSELTQEFIIKELQAAPEVLLPAKPHSEQFVRSTCNSGDSHFSFVLPCPGFQVVEPSMIAVDFVRGEQRIRIGRFTIGFLKTRDLDSQEIRDIRRKGTGNVAMLHVSCKKCKSDLVIYKSLAVDGSGPPTSAAKLSVEQLSDEYVCTCGETRFDTRFLKLGIHEVFRHHFKQDGDIIKLTSCYNQTAISSIVSSYRKLIETTPPEETVQRFFVENPILWSFLAPVATILKPRLSTHYTADFAILTPTKTLYFVELEKPQTKLVKAAGGQAAELQAGKDQIDAWRTWIEDHRADVLAELRIAPEQVHAIKFILVAGLESATPTDTLRAVRDGMKDDVSFYTFDEIANFARGIDLATKEM